LLISNYLQIQIKLREIKILLTRHCKKTKHLWSRNIFLFRDCLYQFDGSHQRCFAPWNPILAPQNSLGFFLIESSRHKTNSAFIPIFAAMELAFALELFCG